jgi:hypothetical protein
MTPNDLFESFVVDDYVLNGQVTTIITLTNDIVSGMEYLSGGLRIVKGEDRDFPIEIMSIFGLDGSWAHVSLGLNNSQIGELSRLVIPDWASGSKPFILRILQDVAISIASRLGIHLLYVNISEGITETLVKAKIQVKKVERTYLLYYRENSRVLYPKACSLAKYYSSFWQNYRTGVYVFSDYGLGSKV